MNSHAEADFRAVDFIAESRDVGGVIAMPIGAHPPEAGVFPFLEDDVLAAIDSAGEIDVLFLRAIEPWEHGEGDGMELETLSEAMA